MKRRGNKHGIGGQLPGEPSRNKEGVGGYGDNPTMLALTKRRRHSYRVGQTGNPYGYYGYKAVGKEKMASESKRSPEGMKATLDAREAQQLAREEMKTAIERVSKILKDNDASDMAAIAAFHALADRAYGKPTQTNVNANMDMDAKPSELSANDLERRIVETLERVERVTERKRETLTSEDGSVDLREFDRNSGSTH